ncbi:TPA: hypothetical protein DDW35_09480 [Candidatus Sumerlaeota bacterium]|jgi:hypothetical protein|nr:hypothetical protein [Candidatus Sumerlaeota bacterium]
MKKIACLCCLIGTLGMGAFAQVGQKMEAMEAVITPSTRTLVLPERVELADLARISDPGTNAGSKNYLTELIKLRDKDGRDNALIHYEVSGWALSDNALFGKDGLDDKSQDVMKNTMAQGWNAESSRLLPFLEMYQSTFAEVRRGAALDYAKNIGCERGMQTPTPDYLVMQIVAKMLCVEGRYFESQGLYAKALDNYLTVLTLGRDLGGADQMIIGNFISIAVQNLTMKPLSDLLAGGHLARPDLERALSRLKQLQKTGGTTGDIIQGEAKYCKSTYLNLAQKVKQAQETAAKDGKNLNELLKQATKESLGYELPLSPAEVKNLDKVVDQVEENMKMIAQAADKPFYERDFEKEIFEMQQKMKGQHPMSAIALPNFHECEVRHLIKTSKMLAAQLQAALELARLEKGRYPEKLGELAPKYFDVLPIDPFSGNGFLYTVTADGKSYSLTSTGPDKTFGPAGVSYDATNGSCSAGDVLFGKR